MAYKSFVLMETVVGKAGQVINELLGLEGVDSVNLVTGPYDVIAVVKGVSLNDIGDLVTNKIERLPYISRITSCISLNWPCTKV